MQGVAICSNIAPNVPVEVDAVTGSFKIIDCAHHEIHKGEMFCVSQVLAATTNYLLVVPVGKVAHFAMAAVTDATAAGKLELFPLITATAGTAFSQVFNRRTAGGLSPSVVITTAPTGVGTTDATTCAFSGQLSVSGMQAGSLNRGEYEFILTAGNHLVRVTRGASGNINLQMQWYEELA